MIMENCKQMSYFQSRYEIAKKRHTSLEAKLVASTSSKALDYETVVPPGEDDYIESTHTTIRMRIKFRRKFKIPIRLFE